MVEASSSIRARETRPSQEARAVGPFIPLAWSVVLVGLVAAGAAALAWWATGPWGSGLSPDAIAYSAIAEGIRDGSELGYWLEPSVSSWPPLFPLVLATGSMLLDISVVDTARILNAVLHAATVVVVALLACRLMQSTWLRALALATAALAQPLVFVTVKVWSEPLFNLLILIAALVLSGVPGRRPTSRLLAASVLVVAAFSTRYAGLVFVPAGALVLALWPRSSPRAGRYRRAAWFGVPALVGGLMLVGWNRWRTGDAFGPRWRPDEPFWSHAADGLGAIGQWFLPSDSPRPVALLFGMLLISIAVCAVVWTWKPTTTPNNNHNDSSDDEPIGVAPILAVFMGAYFAYMVWARTTSGFDPLNSRLMLPVFLPGVLLMLSVVDRWSATKPEGASRLLVLALPLLVLLPTMVDGLDEARRSHDIGSEYTNAAVQEFVNSPILSEIPDDCSLLTNDPWLLWLAGREAQLTPEQDREVAIPLSMELTELAPLVSAGHVCLVWLDTGSTVFFEPAQLAEVVVLDRVAHDEFTTIYRLAPVS